MKTYLLRSLSIKLFTLLAFFALAFGIPSCKPCGDIDEFFDVEQITISNHRIISPTLDEPFTGDSILFDDYFIKCGFTVNYYSQNTPNYNLMNSTYAISCISPGERGSSEGIDTVLVITQSDYDSTFLAGDTLSPIININSNSYRKRFEPLSEFITENRSTIYGQYGFDIQLTSKPQSLTTPYTFDVIIKLGNGEEYRSTTTPVYFQ